MRRAALAAPLALTGCDWAVLNPKGFVGISDVTILIDSVAIMLAIVVPTIVATLAFAWWFRASNTRATYLPDFAYSGRLELIVWAHSPAGHHAAWRRCLDRLAPARSGRAAAVEHASRSRSRPSRSIGNGCSSTRTSTSRSSISSSFLSGRPVHFSLTSGSVMTAFFVPQLGSMIYTMNGMVTQLNLRADAAGTYLWRWPAISAATAFPTCILTCARCRRTSSPPG